MLDEIRAKRNEIYAIAKRHKAEKLWVFGSCARKEERPDSDVDFLVKFSRGASLFDQGAIQSGLSSILGQGVDVVDSDVLSREPYFAYTVRKDLVALGCDYRDAQQPRTWVQRGKLQACIGNGAE